jgi:hypothetical protein
MSWEAWGDPPDGPELPEGWLDEDQAAELRDTLAELLAALQGMRSFDYKRGDLIHQSSMEDRCKCAACIEGRADKAIANALELSANA